MRGKFNLASYLQLIAAVTATFNCCTSDEGKRRSVVPILECGDGVILNFNASFVRILGLQLC